MSILRALRDFIMCALGHDPLHCQATSEELAEFRDANVDYAAEVQELHRRLAESQWSQLASANVHLAHRAEQAELRLAQVLDERRRAG